MALAGCLPDVSVTNGFVLFVFTILETDAYREIEQQPAADGQSIAVLHTRTKTKMVGLIAASSPLYVVSHSQHIGTEVMAGWECGMWSVECGMIGEVTPNGEVATIALPVAVTAVGREPRVEPVGTGCPLFAERHLDTDVRNEHGIIEQIGLQGKVLGLTRCRC